MTSLLIFILLLIITLIFMAFYSDATKNNKKVNWVAVVLASLPFVLFIGFFIAVNMFGTSDNFRLYP